ncbi:organic anion transporter 3-like [Bombina bombina]|uniref:organic anion transporter 3-like n=1 Tax=Bombina bombina TaxID=8345 RepID=UPI00235A6B6A|nr:organic anion transporter 3-like [Bombina bombina]
MVLKDALDKDSLFSPFQLLLVFLISTPLTLCSTHNFIQIFTGAVPPHHCRSNFTQRRSNQTDLCTRYISPLSNETEPCGENGWEYDHSVYSSTIISEWDLVCQWEFLKEMAQSIYMAGVLVGAIMYGTLADRFGRRIVLLCCVLQVATMGTGTALSPNFSFYCVFRFLTGMGMCGFVINGLGLTMEWIPMRYRPTVSMVQGYCLTAGQIILGGVAYACRDWRWLQMALSLPFFIFFVLVWWVPESYRWLVLTNRSQKALTNLNRVAKINGKKIGSDITLEMLQLESQNETSTKTSRYTPLDLFRTPAMRRITLSLTLIWFSSSFCFFALAMDVQRFGFSIYLVQVIFGCTELPLRIISTITASYIGRRFTVSFLLILSGVLILLSLALPPDRMILQLSFTALAKGCLGSSIVCAYLYTAELFPTLLRQTGIGFTNMMMRLGAVITPLVIVTKAYMPSLPTIIFGVLPIFCGVPILWLPETLNCPLTDTIEEVETRSRELNGILHSSDTNLIRTKNTIAGVFLGGVFVYHLLALVTISLNPPLSVPTADQRRRLCEIGKNVATLCFISASRNQRHFLLLLLGINDIFTAGLYRGFPG